MAQPFLPPLDTGDDPLCVELKLGLLTRSLARRLLLISPVALQLLLALAKELPPPLGCPQLLGQLIAARLAIQLILGFVRRLGAAGLQLSSGAATPGSRVARCGTSRLGRVRIRRGCSRRVLR